MAKLYIIAGCNGAGKTTASYTILPEILNCKEFVNADEIARGLSPFQSEKMALQAGRIMLNRINELLKQKQQFAFETTLASRTYIHIINKAKKLDYETTLLFFWLNSINLAISRVNTRVKEGGHNIPKTVIQRRYERGLKNFFQLYQNKLDNWTLLDNSGNRYKEIAQSIKGKKTIFDKITWKNIKNNYGKTTRTII